ncbi:MAG: hypothetical protein ACK501_13120 [Planctomycetota bacterium]|jgi:hypothetical protein
MLLLLSRLSRFPWPVIGVLGLLPAQAQWVQLPTPVQPDAVASPGLAFDGARQVSVLFGGDSAVGLHDRTWTWDGTVWTERFPVAHPSARTMVAMAYDAARQRVVLFGGFGVTGGVANESNETWEWDGGNWTLRQPLHAPSPRGGASLAYDATRQCLVLFGGGLGGYMMPTFDDTWEWDGVDWVQRFPLHRPTAARNGGLAYDTQRGVCVLFGGLSTSYQKQDATWEWNGVDWTRRYPAHVPTARYAAGLAYDSARGRTVLFGGGLDSGLASDTWEYDGVDWQLVAPATVPSARDYVKLAYDGVRGRIVMRGGRVADTWEFAASPGPLATYGTFGAGCAGWAGTPWLTSNGDRPVLGQPFSVFLYNLPPDHSTLMCLGLSNTSWGGVPLPFALDALGAPGCSLLVSADVLVPVFNWAGYATWTWVVPSVPALAGLAFHNQAAAIDHANVLGLVFTNGGHGVIGDH